MPRKLPSKPTSTFDVDEDPGKIDPTLARLFCNGCRHFLVYHKLELGTLVVKCRRCKQWTTLSVSE